MGAQERSLILSYGAVQRLFAHVGFARSFTFRYTMKMKVVFMQRGNMMRSMVLLLALAACGPNSDTEPGETDTGGFDTDSGTVDPNRYVFLGRTGASSVAYDGQVFRQLLIADLKTYLGGLTARIDGGYVPNPGDVERDLLFYYAFSDANGAEVEHLFRPDPAARQTTYGEVSSGKDLKGKIAGNDPVGQHRDWSLGVDGWTQPGVTSPDSLVLRWIAEIDAAAVDRANGKVPVGPDGKPVAAVFLSADGRDRQQLLEKFLRGAVSFSQGADDYLDDDLEGKGINSDHTQVEEGKAWTTLEHQWDEGFGYFGASVAYPTWDKDLIAGAAVQDDDGDGVIDLLTEVSWGASTNAAKRDTTSKAPTDLVGEAWEGFHAGRALLATTTGPLSAADREDLKVHRDQAVLAWEKALAASAVHYINQVLRHHGRFGTQDYRFSDHAKHWSELKGFALSLQFNPRSPLSDADFVILHGYLGDQPVLPTASGEVHGAYRSALLQARALLGRAYGFDAANLGDDDGNGGW
jgi:hypothetical protein